MTSKTELAHKDLRSLRDHLHSIHLAAASFEPLTPRPPIIDTSIDDEDTQWRSEDVPGMRLLKEAIKGDLDRLEALLEKSPSADLSSISTNSPYLIAVWNEVLCATYPVVAIFRAFDAHGEGSTQQQSRPKNDGNAKGGQPGVKVDVVCNGGAQWIRVNTIKNSRMLAELREIDSYETDSDSDADDGSGYHQPSLAQKEFDNSLLRMGRALLASSKENPVPGTSRSPQVTLRLTRLDPSEPGVDPRIARIVKCLHSMGIDVQLGERSPDNTTALPRNPAHVRNLQPTLRVNLDLSTIIALVSDLTHAPLPRTVQEASARFQPSERYLEWKRLRITTSQPAKQKTTEQGAEDKREPSVHARALTAQVMQEMAKGLLEEMRDRLFGASPVAARDVQFWTTAEVRDRAKRILSKIGGPGELRRADALFPAAESDTVSLESCEAQYWGHSRYARGFVPIVPIHVYPSTEPPSYANASTLVWDDLSPSGAAQTPFFATLATTCRHILAQETVPHPRALPLSVVNSASEIQRASVTKANPRLTEHTVQSLLWGAELGWTTLTANKSSVKAIWRDMKGAREAGKLDLDRDDKEEGGIEAVGADVAALWIVDPRSLAEGQRADSNN